MKKYGLLIGICGLAIAGVVGCGASNSSKRGADAAAKGTPVEVKANKLVAKTAKGTPLEIYEVTTTIPGEAAAKTFAVVVAGESPGTVEIRNARYAVVGGKQVDMALGNAPGEVCLIPAKNLMRTTMLSTLSRADLLKQAATGKVELPEADQ